MNHDKTKQLRTLNALNEMPNDLYYLIQQVFFNSLRWKALNNTVVKIAYLRISSISLPAMVYPLKGPTY